LRGKIQPDHLPFFANLVSRYNDVYPAAAPEIHNHLTWLKVCKSSGIAATPGKIDADCRHQRKFFLPVKGLVNRIARTGLSLARSTGLLITTGFSKTTVARYNRLPDFLS
jgi:hypothetical protein